MCVCEADGRGVERSRDLDSVTNMKVRLSEEWRKVMIVRREMRAFDTCNFSIVHYVCVCVLVVVLLKTEGGPVRYFSWCHYPHFLMHN